MIVRFAFLLVLVWLGLFICYDDFVTVGFGFVCLIVLDLGLRCGWFDFGLCFPVVYFVSVDFVFICCADFGFDLDCFVF